MAFDFHSNSESARLIAKSFRKVAGDEPWQLTVSVAITLNCEAVEKRLATRMRIVE
jgi:hypothetical protein